MPKMADELPAEPAAGSVPLLAAAKSLPCRDDGRLQTTLFGTLSGPLDWSSDQLECSGMPRPNGAGVRLRFAGPLADAERVIAIIIAIPDLEPGSTGDELSSKITLIDEGRGRFFSTWDINNCWTDISSQEPVGETGGRVNIDGTLYCVAPLAEVNGDGSISIVELSFSGSLDWNAK